MLDTFILLPIRSIILSFILIFYVSVFQSLALSFFSHFTPAPSHSPSLLEFHSLFLSPLLTIQADNVVQRQIHQRNATKSTQKRVNGWLAQSSWIKTSISSSNRLDILALINKLFLNPSFCTGPIPHQSPQNHYQAIIPLHCQASLHLKVVSSFMSIKMIIAVLMMRMRMMVVIWLWWW